MPDFSSCPRYFRISSHAIFLGFFANSGSLFIIAALALFIPSLEPGLPIVDPHVHFWHHKSGYKYFVEEFARDAADRPDFAAACAREGIIFIGPDSKVLDRMGDKTAARAVAEQLKVPTLKGTEEPVDKKKDAMIAAKKIGFPLIIKAAFGGGGRGMRVVREAKDLEKLLDEAQTEALRSFGNGAVFLEKFVGKAKHIEVQILADKHGHVLHLHERDCSVQRRHQKVIEQAHSYGVKQSVIDELCEAAVKLAKEVNYTHAGTVEFLVDHETGEWFFIEMNPRIQVEHTVTEEITGIDIVRSQILIAQGYQIHEEPLALPVQEKIEDRKSVV